MPLVATLVAIGALFYLLGKSADLVVLNLRRLGEKIGVDIYFLGLLLGLLTSLPELAIGINALTNNLEGISVGNLLGGLFVLFGVVLSVSLLVNRSIKTDTRTSRLVPVVLYLYFPILLGLDGRVGFVDGLLLVALYPALLLLLYYRNGEKQGLRLRIMGERRLTRELVGVAMGIPLVLLFSNLIIRLTTPLLAATGVPAFYAGLVLFSLGTNLPELIVTLQSWKRHVRDLAFSNLLGSAMANILLLGTFALIRPLPLGNGPSFLFLALFLFVLLGALAVFSHTGRRLTFREGVALLIVYLLFLLSQTESLLLRTDL